MAKKLSIEELDARHAAERAERLAKLEETERKKEERARKREGARRMASLISFLARNELALSSLNVGGVPLVQVTMRGEVVGFAGLTPKDCPEEAEE